MQDCPSQDCIMTVQVIRFILALKGKHIKNLKERLSCKDKISYGTSIMFYHQDNWPSDIRLFFNHRGYEFDARRS